MQASFADTPTCARARARLSDAVAAGHPAILLLGEHPSLTTALLRLVASDLAAAGHAVHHLAADNLRPTDLAHADPRVLVAIDRVDLLSRPALLALEEHLRLPATRLLLAGQPSFRDRTAMPGLMTLHFAPLVVGLPRLPPGDPLATERPSRGRLPSLAGIAESRPLAPILDRPLAALAASAALAILAAAVAAPVSITRPAASTTDIAAPAFPPPVAAPVTPPIQAGLPFATAQGSAATQEPGIIVDRVDPDALLSPRIVHARQGDTLRSLYTRIYRGLDAPSFAAVASLNRYKLAPGARLVFPAPSGGWPAR